MSRFYNLDQVPFNSRELSKAIVAAISGQYNGAYFDAQDISTMFQDAAGTVPVTAMEQPIGKWLDISGNGNHATQSVTASRPVISARYNLLTKTEDFAHPVWIKAAGVITNHIIPNPVGSALVNKFTPDTTSSIHRVAQAWTPTLNAVYVQRILLKSAGVRYVNLNNYANARSRATIDLQTGNVISLEGTIRAVSENLGDGWFALDVVGTGTSVIGNNTWFQANNAFNVTDNTYSGNGVDGFYLIAADLRLGVSADVYQRVNTATDYDSVGFKKYIKFDGVDDYLNVSYMGLYANGAASIVAARDALSQTVDTYVISERSTSNVNPKYFPSRQLANAGNMDSYIVNDAAAVVVDTVGSAYGGASNAVVMSAIDSGNNIKLFKNGALAANDNYTRSGTLTLTNTTIGASVSTTTSNYANMKLYGLCIAKSALSDLERRRVERLLAYNSGVQI